MVIDGGMLVDAASTPACGYRTLALWNKAPFLISPSGSSCCTLLHAYTGGVVRLDRDA